MNTTLFSNSTLVDNATSLYIGNCLLVDPDGFPYVDWMYSSMGQCVHSPLEQSSFYVGLASLGLYIVSGIPQVIENFIKGNADGLSPYTLALFIIGDSSNLLGAILTHQLFTQILLAIYFVTIELVLIAQFIGYKLKAIWQRRKNKHREEDDKKNSNTLSCTSMTITPLEEHNHEFLSDGDHHDIHHNIKAFKNDEEEVNGKRFHSALPVSILALIGVLFCFLMFSSSDYMSSQTTEHNQVAYGRKLLSIDETEVKKDHNTVQFPPVATEAIIGYVIGFISTTCSISSRIAQIAKNFARGNTLGMNPLLFGCSVFGNILYSSSIFLFSVDGNFLLNKIPWLTSSLVNIALDSFIISQYVFYTFIKKRKSEEKTNTTTDSEQVVKDDQQSIQLKLKALEV